VSGISSKNSNGDITFVPRYLLSLACMRSFSRSLFDRSIVSLFILARGHYDLAEDRYHYYWFFSKEKSKWQPSFTCTSFRELFAVTGDFSENRHEVVSGEIVNKEDPSVALATTTR